MELSSTPPISAPRLDELYPTRGGERTRAPAPRRRSADVVVIGAGLSGLAAASRLVESGHSVVVLEARAARVGGRLESATVAGHTVDLGGAWIGAHDRRAARLLERAGLSTWPSHCDGEAVVAQAGRCTRARAHRVRHPLATLDARRACRRLDRLAGEIALGAPWRSAGAARADTQTLEHWLTATARTSAGRRALRGTLANVLGADPAGVSLLHALFYVRSSGGLRTMLAGAGGAQQDLVAGGAQALAAWLAAELGDAVELGSPVRRIEHGPTHVRAVCDSLAVEAGTAIVAVAPALAARIEYAPALPAAHDQLSQAMPHGDVVKVVAAYDEAFWRADGLSGEAWGDDLPFSFSHDVSPPGGEPGALALFLVGERARRHRRSAPDRRRAGLLSALGRCFGPRAATPLAVAERDWALEPWSRGAYGAFMPPGVWTRCGEALREPVGRIAWAGSETAVEHNGYMEGAVEAGERAAAEALVLA